MFGGSSKARHTVVTYAAADRQAAIEIARHLEERGVRVWIAPRDLDPRAGAADQSKAAIEASVAVLLVVSDAGNRSKMLRNEAEVAVGTAPVLPLRIEEVRPADALWSLVHGQPMFDLFGDGRADALNRLTALLLDRQRPGRRREKPRAASEETGPSATIEPVALPPLSPTAALRTYVGPNALPILDRWRAMAAAGTAREPFLSGLLLSRYWLAYRKLYLPALASTLVALALVAFALRQDGRDEHGYTLPVLLALGLLALPVWQWGMALYRWKATRAADRANLPGADAEAVTDKLGRRGGRSWPAALALVAVEVAAVVALARTLDPDVITARLPVDETGSVDGAAAADPAGAPYYNLCIANPTATQVHLVLRYGAAAPQEQLLRAHTRPVAFWSRTPDPITISFDHVLGDGTRYSDRSYRLTPAQAADRSSCGDARYHFEVQGTDLDLKLG